MKKMNRTSSDLMDKIIQNRHGKEGWEEIKFLFPDCCVFYPVMCLTGLNNTIYIYYPIQ